MGNDKGIRRSDALRAKNIVFTSSYYTPALRPLAA
jgi:hypothetical protein